MTEDSSYNLTNITNFSTIIELQGAPGSMDNLFTIFQIGLTYDMSINDLETMKIIDISMNKFVNLNNLLKNNKFSEFFSYLIIDISIDEAYEKFKRCIEIYPSILLRRRRNIKIKKTDFIMLEDFEISETEKQAWKDYRQQLRNITDGMEDDEIILYNNNTFNVEWPSVPNVNMLLLKDYYDYD